MGRTKRKKKSSNSGEKQLHTLEKFSEESRKDGSKSEDVKFIDKLLDKADMLINSFEYETAQKFCQRALDVEPDNLRALETSSGLMLEVGEVDSAVQCLEKAVEISPNSGHSKYLTLGQLYRGNEAIVNYKKGINLLEIALENMKGGEASENLGDCDGLRRMISSAYCSVCEIYMSDCCFEEAAETQCKLHIDKAIEADPNNPEAHQCLASFLLVRDKKLDATEAMKHSLSLWLPKHRDIRDGKLENTEYDPVEICPLSYDVRINTSKLLIELELYDEAVEVLEGLVDENDEVVEVWHLLGWANYLRGEIYKQNAIYYLTKATKVAKKNNFDDADLMKHVADLLDKLGPCDEESEGDDENDEQWEDLSDDEEMQS